VAIRRIYTYYRLYISYERKDILMVFVMTLDISEKRRWKNGSAETLGKTLAQTLGTTQMEQ
jgi:hypothetical protein